MQRLRGVQSEKLMNVASIDRLGDIVIIKVNKRMDVLSAPPLMAEFNSLLDEGHTHFVVDLTAVRFLDSEGDYPLLHLLKRTQEVDGNLYLVCPLGNPIRVSYELMHLDVLFEMDETLDAALARCRASLKDQA